MTTNTDIRWVIDGVRVANLLHVWDDCWPYIEKAIKRFPQLLRRYSEAVVLKSLYDKRMQLWVAWDTEKNKVCGAVVTQITGDDRYPDDTFLSILFAGGDNWNGWGDAIWTLLKQWGVHMGCTHAIVCGRKGWKRLYGFVDCGTTADGIPAFIRTLKERHK